MKTTFNTMIRVLGSWSLFGAAFSRVFEWYGWKLAVIITDNSPTSVCQNGATTITSVLVASNVTVDEWIQMDMVPDDTDIEGYLSRIKQRARS